jgi:hypothetical protein
MASAGCSDSLDVQSSQPEQPAWDKLGREIARDADDAITDITFRFDAVTDEDFQDVSKLARVESVTIQECSGLSDKALEQIATLPKLRRLRIRQVPFTDKGVAALKNTQTLRELWLQHTELTGAGLEALAELPLETLHLGGAKLTDEGLACLPRFESLTDLQVNAGQLHLNGFPSLLPLEKLRRLDLAKVRVDDDAIARFAGLPLTILVFDDDRLTDAGLERLSACTELEELHLSHSQVTDDGLQVLRAHTKLKKLSLGPQHTDSGVAHLRSLEGLEALNATASQVSGATLPQLAGLRHLSEIDLNVKRVTSAGRQGAKTLRESLPECAIFAWNMGAGSATEL